MFNFQCIVMQCLGLVLYTSCHSACGKESMVSLKMLASSLAIISGKTKSAVQSE